MAIADTGNPRCRSTLPVLPQRCRRRLYACRPPGDGKCVLSAKETVPASPKTAPRGVTAPLALLPITPLSEAISPALRWVQWPSLRCDEPAPRMSIPAVTAPRYCRPVRHHIVRRRAANIEVCAVSARTREFEPLHRAFQTYFRSTVAPRNRVQ